MTHTIPPGQCCDTDNQPCVEPATKELDGKFYCDKHYQEELEELVERLR